MSLTIKELEELIQAAPNKNLPVHIQCWDADMKCTIKEAKLENKELLLIETGDEVEVIEEEEDEDDDE